MNKNQTLFVLILLIIGIFSCFGYVMLKYDMTLLEVLIDFLFV